MWHSVTIITSNEREDILMEKDGMIFARNLKNLRHYLKLTMEQFAEKIYVQRQTVSLWESGTGNPTLDSIRNICCAFNVSSDAMLFGNVLDDIVAKKDKEEKATINDEKSIKPEKPYTAVQVDDEMLDDIWGLTYIDISEILMIAVGLKKRGYIITDLYEQGFTVILKPEKSVIQLRRDIFNIMEHLIHYDNEYLVGKQEEYSSKLEAAKSEIISDAFTEILGASPDSFRYYCVDDRGIIRGYGNTIEECQEILIEQRSIADENSIMEM